MGIYWLPKNLDELTGKISPTTVKPINIMTKDQVKESIQAHKQTRRSPILPKKEIKAKTPPSKRWYDNTVHYSSQHI
jgi:hypothetical protein